MSFCLEQRSSRIKPLRLEVCPYVRVELLSKDEVGGRAGDGDESSDGCSVGDAQSQALTDHVVLLGGILGVSPGLHPLHIWDFDFNLIEKQTFKRLLHTYKENKSMFTNMFLTCGRCPLVCAIQSWLDSGFRPKPFDSPACTEPVSEKHTSPTLLDFIAVI